MNHIEQQPELEAETSTVRTSTIGLTTLASAALAACGGGGSDSPNAAAPSAVDSAGLSSGASGISRDDAWRFLNQATMGPSEEDLKFVMNFGYKTWLNNQFAMALTGKPLAPTPVNYATMDPITTPIEPLSPYLYTEEFGKRLVAARIASTEVEKYKVRSSTEFIRNIWWRSALTSKDQLRQRVVFALSEIIVVSLLNMNFGNFPLLAAGWMDMLRRNAFGSYRKLIDDVVLSPAMGVYLSHLNNNRPNDNGQEPDQNFARELIQLFTLGLVKLNENGTVQMNANGAVNMSPTQGTDIRVLSHVFVGLSFDGTNNGRAGTALTRQNRPFEYFEFPQFDDDLDNAALARPMKPFPAFHCDQADVNKTWARLGQTGSPKLLGSDYNVTTGNPTQSIKAALDLIFAHPNLAPFIAKQMIQRLVTSNPTDGYVLTCARAFKLSGYSLKTLVETILMHDEASLASSASEPKFGKVREPLLRITHLLRAFKANPGKDSAGMPLVPNYDSGDLSAPFNVDSPSLALGQSPLSAINVFNFFSPSYVAANSKAKDATMVAPELQLANETTVASYINAVQSIVADGFFNFPSHRLDLSAEYSISNVAVVDAVNQKLMGGKLSDALRLKILDALTAASATELNGDFRAKFAILMVMASPEYIVQK